MLGDQQGLKAALLRLDGKGYKAYRDVEGGWAFPSFTLHVDHVQGDPYAAPSRLRVRVPAAVAGFPSHLWAGRVRKVALCDWLARRFSTLANTATRQNQQGWHGAKGGDVSMDAPSQHVLERSAVLLLPDGGVEARFTIGLPAQGRSIMGQWAAQILAQNLPGWVDQGLVYARQDQAAIWRHIQVVEDTDALRAQLEGVGLVAFVGDGSILPRLSGASDLPMTDASAVPFAAPESLAVTLAAPHRGPVRGLGVRAGVTLIVGGGFHGKSTLLDAIQVGCYDKVPGDGRELVVSLADCVKIRAEDGRRVEGVDIRPFISGLPGGRGTAAFRSDDASGSTSQAANIQEALEVGSRLLLLDEDTCATNLMVRDGRMAALVEREPITPLTQRIGALRGHGVSSVLVMGGSGDYLGLADTVICMDSYSALDFTDRAHAIAAAHAAAASAAAPPPDAAAGGGGARIEGYGPVPRRLPAALHPEGPDGLKVAARAVGLISYGTQDIQLAAVEQLVDRSQTRAVADALKWLHARINAANGGGGGGRRSLVQLLDELEAAIDEKGLDALSPRQLLGSYARPRRFEVAAALNRLRSLRVA
ncbi:MAG: hypothetical protein J3K34DRAFT_213442 [Monoraphidium minutum]|nr:MAG: hypothetical protein J3K34DRAFT_213442 [Monoraphidium minutum]